MVDTIILVGFVITTILSIFFGFYAIKFGIILLRVQDQTEESLDILDDHYQKISYILEVPLANDSPQVREIVDCLKDSRDAVLKVGHVLMRHASEEETEEVEKD